ncbi:hypothetical protein [uncultured Gimesia sp.]|uniref:hypothetical protein n=1 Tax=uncultured Gimesia sp. TaxID=1678688 RepID=UPI00261BE8EC|nr:hypothetical protein [uncultured Gimesia sp.]
MNSTSFIKHITLCAAFSCLGTPNTFADESKAILKPNSTQDSFDFETKQMSGTIRLDGAYHGVTRLTDKRTGKQVIDTRYSALNFYKLMSVNQVMDEPRKMARTIKFGADWVEVNWAATESHQGVLTARYEVSEPNVIDLTLILKSSGTYSAYEVFMPNYFDKALIPHVYLWTRGRRANELVLPSVNDVFRETVLVFPRDAHASRHCIDGRWDRSEWNRSTVQMCPVRHYARCLAFMTDQEKKLGVVLMSRPQDCYAISTRYHADNDADRLTSYSAFDFSLFGDNVISGDERTVRVRLALTPLDSELSQPLKLYQTYLSEMNGPRK